MKSPVLIILFLLSTASMRAQILSPHECDSIRNMVCSMEHQDQAIRAAFEDARKRKDTTALDSLNAEMYQMDKKNFNLLSNIMKTIGFPCPQLLGNGTCSPFGVFIHWGKEYPGWFNSPENVAIIKKEMDNGHLPRCMVDLAQFMYISFIKPKNDMKYFKLVNSARLAYGFIPYTQKQFTKDEWIQPMMNDNTPAVSRISH